MTPSCFSSLDSLVLSLHCFYLQLIHNRCILCGVPQGSVLAPLLFCLYTVNSPEKLSEGPPNCSWYAGWHLAWQPCYCELLLIEASAKCPNCERLECDSEGNFYTLNTVQSLYFFTSTWVTNVCTCATPVTTFDLTFNRQVDCDCRSGFFQLQNPFQN